MYYVHFAAVTRDHFTSQYLCLPDWAGCSLACLYYINPNPFLCYLDRHSSNCILLHGIKRYVHRSCV